jgi:D-arabinose 1-dehydrogenase-like Zn-dependent alcohol dehydrogenase
MKCIPITEPNGPLNVVERDTPTPGPGQILVDVEACGVCHSDVFTTSAGFPGIELPRVPGHEIAGKVSLVGEGVTAWAVGDRVGVGWHGGHCFACDACKRADYLNCANGKITGISHDGGWASHVVVPWESAARIPDELPAAEAGPLLCAGITTFNALRNSGARPGDTVAVLGLGGLGHLGVQYARNMGFRTIALSRGTSKQELAAKLGAHHYIDTAAAPVGEQLQALGGADLILATAPNAQAISDAFHGLSARGKLLVVGAAQEALSIPGFDLLSGKAVAGWPSGSAIDSEDAMKFSALFGVKPHIETFPLENAGEALAKCLENKVRFRSVLVP